MTQEGGIGRIQSEADLKRVVREVIDEQPKTAANEVILLSPDGSPWRVTVDNAGALATEAL